MYLVCNRGKRSVTLQAHRPEAAEIVDALLSTADVVIRQPPLANS
ncbi:CoA transferase [Mycobacterium avium]